MKLITTLLARLTFPIATKRIATSAVAVALCLSLVACSTSQVVTDIEIASDLVAVSAPVVAAFAGPGAPLIAVYMTAAANGLNCVLTAAEVSGANTATISAAFATCLAQVAVPVLPSGTPAQIGAIIMAVATAIGVLVTKYGPKTVAAGAPVKFKLTFQDKRRISTMHKRLGVAIGQLAHGRS